MFRFIEAFKLALQMINKQYETAKHNEWTSPALVEYRKIWPKTPYTCCDDSHEAGWTQGYAFAKMESK